MDPFGHDTYFSIFDVAEQQGVDARVVHDWIKEGLRHDMLPGYTQISSTDLRKFLESRRKADVTPTVESDESDRLITPQAYADLCDFHVRHIEKWISEGLPVHERDGVRLVDRDEISTFLKPRIDKIMNEPDHGTHSGAVRGEATGTQSVIIAEEFHHGFFG